LEGHLRAVETVLGQLGLRSIRLRYAQLPGFLASLPLGLDAPARSHPMTASAVAAAFPFAGAGASGGAVLLGVDPYGGGLVEFNPFDRAARANQGLPNDHIVILGVSGGGKSLLAKLIALRALPLRPNPRSDERADCWIIDRDGEYRGLVNLAAGRRISLAPGRHGAGLNPLDLPPPANEPSEAPAPIAERLLRVSGLIGLLAGDDGQLRPRQRAIIERAIAAAYAAAGIDDSPTTHRRTMPTLADVQQRLAQGDAEATDLAFRPTIPAWRRPVSICSMMPSGRPPAVSHDPGC
jgi:type IV secretory pathway VirB4 component